MISQNSAISPLSISHILNPNQNFGCHKDNFIIPPLINNNNHDDDKKRISDLNSQTKEEPKSSIIQNTQLPQFYQLPILAQYSNSSSNIIKANSQTDLVKQCPPLNPLENKNNKPLSTHSVSQPCLPVKAKWTKEEDDILKEAISKYGTNNWSLISNEIPGRTGKQCRERWLNQLDPSLNKEHWLPHEDSILTHYQAFYGNSWSKISHFLPGRSPNSVKNRWSFLMRHNALQRARVWF